MKKIVAILFFSLILVSCGKTEETQEELTLTGEVVAESATGALTEDDKVVSPETQQTPEQDEVVTPPVSNTPNVDAPTQTETPTGTGGKTEEEIVDDFEAELDDLFNLLNDDQ